MRYIEKDLPIEGLNAIAEKGRRTRTMGVFPNEGSAAGYVWRDQDDELEWAPPSPANFRRGLDMTADQI